MRFTRLPISLTVSALLSGCAALRIDVNVYQGPLSNDSETQTMQLASMVLAAKPLLDEAVKDLKCKLGEEKQSTASCATLLGTQSLYGPVPNLQLMQSLRDIERSVEAYKEATDKLDSKQSSKISFAPSVANFSSGATLASATLAFLSNEKESSSPALVLNAAKDLNKALASKEKPECIRNVPSMGKASADVSAMWSSAENVEAFLTCIDSSRTTTARNDDLAKALLNFHRNFEDSRQATANIWAGLMRSALLWSDSIDETQTNRKDLTAVRSGYAKAIATFTQVRNLSCAISLKSKSGTTTHVDFLVRAIRAKNQNSALLSRGIRRGTDWSTPDYTATANELEMLLNDNLVAVIAGLKESNLLLMKADAEQIKDCLTINASAPDNQDRSDVEAIASSAARKFGIARGPSVSKQNETVKPEAISAAINQLTDNLSGGFSAGRILDGINALSTQVAKNRALNKIEDKDLKKLRDALVSMGDRLRFIAANSWPSTISGSNQPEQEITQESRALFESIGNAILAHADES